MVKNVAARSCIILSNGPIPTPEHTTVEGGGLRCWGLAKGLRANNAELEITIAYHESYQADTFTGQYESINITTWNIENIADLIQAYDSIVVSYCMGDLSTAVADAIRPDQQLVLDCYVPIYVEVSARNTDDMDREYHAFHSDIGRWAQVLKRGDLFLCASDAQLKYYQGVLSALGRINPVTYGQELMLVVPYGVYREEPKPVKQPISEMIDKKQSYKKLLWFGGIYPWFDLRILIEAVHLLNKSTPAKLIIVGAKNPFNNHPDFVRPYNQLVEYVEKNKLQDTVILKDWVKFEERADWYLDSDLVVVINKIGEENELAWRTRLVDFMWANLPIITNGGDPLGETLIQNGAAIRFNGLTATAMAEELRHTLKDTKQLQKIRDNLKNLKEQFYWDVVTKKLTGYIVQDSRARDLQEYGDQNVLQPGSQHTGGKIKIKQVLSKTRMIPAYARKYGVRNAYFAARTKIHNQFKKVGVSKRQNPSIVMIAHQLDLSGAPYVFLDLAKAIKETPNKVPIEFHTFNPSHKDNIRLLNKMGIKPKIHITRDIGIEFVKGDVVVLNTTAHTTPLKESIYRALEKNTINHLAWFIHEDEPELIFNKEETKRLKSLLNENKLTMYIAAEKAVKNYQKFFGNLDNIRKQPYKYSIPERFQKVREEKDFKKLSFILSGAVADGRKGQLPILYAFKAFEDKYYIKNPERYRDFELVYVGLAQDFLSRQVLKHAPQLLGKRFKYYGLVSHERSSELMMESNITICYSLRECLPLFVFEGMAAGHPILRNDSSGMEEQLFEGKNGFYLESKDFDQIVATIETVLNTGKTASKRLATMSKISNQIALSQANHSYEPMVKDIFSKFNN